MGQSSMDLSTQALDKPHICCEERKWEKEDQDQRSQEQARAIRDYGVRLRQDVLQQGCIAVSAVQSALGTLVSATVHSCAFRLRQKYILLHGPWQNPYRKEPCSKKASNQK